MPQPRRLLSDQRWPVDMSEISRVLAFQERVVSRAQVLDAGGNDNDIARMVRRREWAQVYPGVYVDHTGPLTLARQQESAAVLYCAPAALTGRSALRRYGVPVGRAFDDAATIVHVSVDRGRRLAARPGS